MPNLEPNGVSQYRSELTRNQALRSLGALGLTTLGIGAGIRGLRGLLNLGRRNLTKRDPPLQYSRPIDIPLHRRREEEEEKVATTVGEWFGRPFSQAMRGEGLKSPANWSPYIPLSLLTSVGGLAGGYAATDKVLDWRRKKELETRLEKAKRDYEEALSGRSKLSADLDRLYDAMSEKQADLLTPDEAGFLTGTGLTLAGLLGLGSGVLTYNLAKKKQPSYVLRKAKQRRARERLRHAPPSLYVQPAYDPGEEDATEDEPEKTSSVNWKDRLRKLQIRRGEIPAESGRMSNVGI